MCIPQLLNVALKGEATREQLIDQHPQGILIACRDHLSLPLLWPMYTGVPRMSRPLAHASGMGCAKPKSATSMAGGPFNVLWMKTLADLTSRCTIPWLWAYCRASATWRTRRAASSNVRTSLSDRLSSQVASDPSGQ